MLQKISPWLDGRRCPAAPVTGCYNPHTLPSPVLLEHSGRKTTLLFFIPAVGRSWTGLPGCTARYAVLARHYGEYSLNLKPHRSERRERSSL